MPDNLIEFKKLKLKLNNSVEIPFNNEMEEFITLLYLKIKIHINAIDVLVSNSPHDAFSIIPLTRVCMETFCIISYIKDGADISERNFRWLSWMTKSYNATREGKYDFSTIPEGREIFDKQIQKYTDLLKLNQIYINKGNPELNPSFYKKNPPGYEDLYKTYFPTGKLYNQYSWICHPSAIGCTQMMEDRTKWTIYTNVVLFELNILMKKMFKLLEI